MTHNKEGQGPPSYIGLCFPHWAPIDTLIKLLAESREEKPSINDSFLIIVPNSSLLFARSSKHEFFDRLNALGPAKYLAYFGALGWRNSGSYRWLRSLSVLDKVVRSLGISWLVRHKALPLDSLSLIGLGSKLLACPSAFTAHDRVAVVKEVVAHLSDLDSELTFHGNLLQFQLHEVLPSPIPRAIYHARTTDEEEVLIAKGWAPSKVKVFSSKARNDEAGPFLTLLYLSRGSNDGNDTAASRVIERYAIKWISDSATRAGLELLVRLHPAETRSSFFLKWVRCGLLLRLRQFRIDNKLLLSPADLVVSLHSSAILAAQVPRSRAVELLPFGMLNERVGGPCLGYASRQGAAVTIYTREALINHVEQAHRGCQIDF